ncbi:MAG: type III pantothenate kinase [Candidatus Thiodiazotropha sp.]|jgi:type III pantothenate kinase
MKLFVDIGNSAIKWASEDELKTGVSHRVNSRELPDAIETVWRGMPKPSEVHLASVRHQKITERLTQWVQQHWSLDARVSKTQPQEFGVVNGYEMPTQLGIDRWLALLAARNLSSLPVVVVDCGSATTIDGLDSKGHHMGGVILPGLKLFAKCLHQSTDLSSEFLEGEVDYFATDTATGIRSGAMLTHTCMVEKALQQLEARGGGNANCFLTGGDARLLTKHLRISHQLMPDLVLQGLALQSNIAN